MNDEDFTRDLLTRAFPSSASDEPGMTFEVDQLVRHGRRATAVRRTGILTGGTALASAVVLAAWGLSTLGGGGSASTSVGPGAGPTTAKPESSVAELPKLSKGEPCTTTLDLRSVVLASLPSSVEVESASPVSCGEVGGTRDVALELKLGQPLGSLMVSVSTQVSGAPDPSANEADTVKAAEAGPGAPPAGTDVGPSCHAAVSVEGTVCVTHLVKGTARMTLVALKIPGSDEKAVTVSAGGADNGPVMLSDARLAGVAEAVAAHT